MARHACEITVKHSSRPLVAPRLWLHHLQTFLLRGTEHAESKFGHKTHFVWLSCLLCSRLSTGEDYFFTKLFQKHEHMFLSLVSVMKHLALCRFLLKNIISQRLKYLNLEFVFCFRSLLKEYPVPLYRLHFISLKKSHSLSIVEFLKSVFVSLLLFTNTNRSSDIATG